MPPSKREAHNIENLIIKFVGFNPKKEVCSIGDDDDKKRFFFPTWLNFKSSSAQCYAHIRAIIRENQSFNTLTGEHWQSIFSLKTIEQCRRAA